MRGDAHGLTDRDPGLLRDVQAIYQTAAARGQQLSQRNLARQLRGLSHRFPDQQLPGIAAIGFGVASSLRHGA